MIFLTFPSFSLFFTLEGSFFFVYQKIHFIHAFVDIFSLIWYMWKICYFLFYFNFSLQVTNLNAITFAPPLILTKLSLLLLIKILCLLLWDGSYLQFVYLWKYYVILTLWNELIICAILCCFAFIWIRN